MAIKILITLEGSEEVKSAIDGIAKTGERMMQSFQGAGAGTAPLDDLGKKFQSLTPSIESANQISHGFAESLRVIIPSLRLAGVEIGNFAGFSRLASVGLGGLAAAISGAIVIALANLEEKIATTQTKLAGLFGSQALGQKAFDALEQSAKSLSTTLGGLTPVFEAATEALQNLQAKSSGKFVALAGIDLPTGLAGNIKNTTTAIQNLIKIIRAGGQDEATAEKSATAFFNAMKDGGKLTADALKQMDPGAIRLLAEALGRGSVTAQQFAAEVSLMPIPVDKVLDALKNFTPQAENAFNLTAVRSYKDAWQDLLNTISGGPKGGFTFQGIITGFLDNLRNQLQNAQKDADLLNATFEKLKNLRPELIEHPLPEIAPALPRPKPATPITTLPPGSVVPPPQEIKESLDASGNIIKEFLNKIDQETSAETEDLGRKWGESLFTKPVHDAMLDFDKQVADLFQSVDPQVKEEQRKIAEGWAKSLEAAPPFKLEDLKPVWEQLFDFIKKGLSSAVVTPAGAAEFTGGPLLQQQQQQEQTQPLVAPFQEADNQIRTIWIALMDYISTSVSELDFTPLTQALVAPFTNALPGIRDALLQVEQMIQEIVRQAAAAAGAIQQLNQGGRPGGGGGGFSFQEVASGGYIRGPGTTTSDSIPAWLSNREYVIQARAVDHYGPNLFAALNSMRLPKDLFSHFAMGGLAKALSNVMPRYATGGMAASTGRSLTIVLDGQKFGVNGSADVIDRLERVATMAGIASVGRPPGWVR